MLAVLVALALPLMRAAPASAFGTTAGQGAEHEFITRAALGCGTPQAPTEPTDDTNKCFGPKSIRELAGGSGYLGAVGVPDIQYALLDLQHCDDADYLATPDYPQSRETATAQLEACFGYLQHRYESARDRAGKIVDGNLANLDQAVIPKDGCNLNIGITTSSSNPPGAPEAKCQALEELGGALHGTEDFYSHSNWVDQTTGAPSLTNPPGLGRNDPSPLMNLTAPFAAQGVPAELTTGCFTLLEETLGGDTPYAQTGAWLPLFPVNPCYQRVTHFWLTKDDLGKPRSGDGTNYYRAIQIAIQDTRAQWDRFRQSLDDKYGAEWGHFIACALTHDTVLDCFQLSYTARVTFKAQGDGSSQEGSWTLAMKPAPVERGADGDKFNAAGPVTEAGGYQSSSSVEYGKLGFDQAGDLVCLPGGIMTTKSRQVAPAISGDLVSEPSLPEGATDLTQLTLSTPAGSRQGTIGERYRTWSLPSNIQIDPIYACPDIASVFGSTTGSLVVSVLGAAHRALGFEDPAGATAGLDLWRLTGWTADDSGGVQRDINWKNPPPRPCLRRCSSVSVSETINEHFQLDPKDPNAGDAQAAATSAPASGAAVAAPRSLAPPELTASSQTTGTISGKVTNAASGAAIAGATVTVYDDADNFVDSTTSGSDGTYSVSGVAPSTYKVNFDASAVANYVPQFYNGKTSLATADPVTVSSGQTTTGIDAALEQPAAVSGTVTSAATHAAVAGVTVTAYDSGGNYVANANTDANGSYSIPIPKAGSYRIGFDPSAAGDYLPQFYRGKPSLASADAVAVASGQTTTGIDAALRPGGHITGTVTDAGTGSGVAGAQVTVYDTENQVVNETTTDSQGRYTVTTLPTGTYTVGFDASSAGSGFVPASQFYSGEGTIDMADPVSVTAGQTTSRVDARFTRGGTVSGTVTDAASHAALKGASVTAYDTAGNASASVVTDSSGKYAIAGLAAGSYEIGFQPAAGSDYSPQFYNGKASIERADAVAVTLGKTTAGIDAVLAPAGQVSGTVTDATTHAAIEGVIVTAYDSAGRPAATATTDANGKYGIVGLADGSYKLGFNGSAAGSYLDQYYNGKSSLDSADPVSVSAAAAATGIDAALQIGGQVAGTVTDATTHAPLEGVAVRAYDADGNDVNEGSTDANGSYTVDGLAPGSYTVGFDATGVGNYAPQYYHGRASLATADRVGVDVSKTTSGIDAAMTAGGQITGTVSASATHAAVANVNVTVYDAAGDAVGSATSDAGGKYAVVGLATGSYKVGFDPTQAGNYLAQFYDAKASQDAGDPVAVTAGKTTSAIDAALKTGGQITGTVTDASSHRAIAGVGVTIYAADGTPIANATTDASGKYAATNLEPDAYKVGFDVSSAGNYAPTLQYYRAASSLDGADGVTVATGQTVGGIDMAFAPAAGVTGTITDAATGAAIPDADVTVYDSGGNDVGDAATGSDGKYTVKGLAAGTYTVEFDASGLRDYLPLYYRQASASSSATPIHVVGGHVAAGIDASLDPGGAITGTVTDSSTKQPLQGVEVDVYDGAGDFVASGFTHSSGKYTIAPLPTGSYRVGFDPVGVGSYVTQFAHGRSSLAGADPVTVTAGTSVGGVDAALQSGGQVSGSVTDAATHAAIPAVQVTAYDSSGDPVATANSDSSGNYTLTALPDGSYRVGFDPSGAGDYAPQFAHDKSSLASADAIAIAGGGAVHGVNAALEPGAAIAGAVTDASTHAALAGVAVTLYGGGGAARATTETDSDGSYAFHGLPAGSYDVGFDPSTAGSYVPQFANAKDSLADADPVSVATGQAAGGVDAALEPDGLLSGTVTDATSHGAVADVQVTAYDAGDAAVATVSTDASGQYSFASLAPGSYRIGFDPGGSHDYLSQFSRGRSSLASADAIALAAGKSVGGVDAALQSGGHLSGAVTDASTNAALAGVRVTAYDSNGAAAATATSDASGDYTIPALPAGSYRVGFDSTGAGDYVAQFANGKDSLSNADPIAVPAGGSVGGIDAALQPAGHASGTVTDASTHAALAGVEVTAYDSSGIPVGTATTAASGGYTLPALAAGFYRIGFAPGAGLNYLPQFSAGKPSLASADEVAVEAGKTVAGVDAALQPGGQLSGTVTDASTHAGVENVSANVFDMAGDLVATATTDADGKYLAAGLASGQYRVEFDTDLAPNYAAQAYRDQSSLATASPVTVTAGQTTAGVDAALVSGAKIDGTVTDASTHAVIPGANVVLYDKAGGAIAWTMTDRSGNYTIQRLTADTYQLGFDASPAGNYAPQLDGDVPLASAQTITVNRAMTPGGEVSGTVTDASTKAPVQNVPVTLYDPAGHVVTVSSTGADGKYAVSSLTPGTYKVGFDPPAASSYTSQFYNESGSLAAAAPISVAAGATTPNIDAALTKSQPLGGGGGGGGGGSSRQQGAGTTQHRLSVAVSGDGSVSGSGLSCPGTCSRLYDAATPITLAATPNAGSVFAGWSGACSGIGLCQLTMSSDQQVTATFDAPQQQTTVPDTKIVKLKIDRKHHRASIRFTATGQPSGFQCALSRATRRHRKKRAPAFAPCTSPKTYSGLARGRYTVLVRAFDSAGVDPTPATTSFAIR